MKLGLGVEMEISGRFSPFGINVELGGLLWTSVLKLAVPPQRLRRDTQPEHQDPAVSATQHSFLLSYYSLTMVLYLIHTLNIQSGFVVGLERIHCSDEVRKWKC